MNTIKFSVIIPLYNKENYIIKTIQSVINQTYQYFEIIVVNDGSTDNSLERVKSISDERLKIYSVKNGGVSRARNYGISVASNEFITFLDADDIWDDRFLETIISLKNRYPEAKIFTTGYSIEEKRNIDNIISGTYGDSFIIEDYCGIHLNSCAIFCTDTVCISKDVLLRMGGFAVGIKRGEDLDLWLRISCEYDIAYSATTRATYQRNTENNAMSSYNSYKESFPYWEWYGYSYEPQKSLIRYTTNMIYVLAKSAYRNKKYDDVLFLLKQCKGNYKLLKRMVLKYYCLFFKR